MTVAQPSLVAASLALPAVTPWAVQNSAAPHHGSTWRDVPRWLTRDFMCDVIFGQERAFGHEPAVELTGPTLATALVEAVANEPARGTGGYRAQQPAQVVARGTANRVQRIAECGLQSAAVHPVVRLRVPDRRLDRLAPAQPARFAADSGACTCRVNDLLAGVVGAHSAEPRIDHDRLGRDRLVQQQVARLLQHRAQDVAVIRIAGGGLRVPCVSPCLWDKTTALLAPNS